MPKPPPAGIAILIFFSAGAVSYVALDRDACFLSTRGGSRRRGIEPSHCRSDATHCYRFPHSPPPHKLMTRSPPSPVLEQTAHASDWRGQAPAQLATLDDKEIFDA
jgi:hypothetical protein